MHFVAMAFPNGGVIALPGAVDKVPGTNGAEVKDKEGVIVQSSDKAADEKTIAGTTLTGAGVGGLVRYASGSPGTAVGVGAGVVAAVGVIATMMQHGTDIVFPEGSSWTMVMQCPLEVQEQQLRGIKTLTVYDGPEMTPVNAQQLPLSKPQPQQRQINLFSLVLLAAYDYSKGLITEPLMHILYPDPDGEVYLCTFHGATRSQLWNAELVV
jgi:hypothetical protein